MKPVGYGKIEKKTKCRGSKVAKTGKNAYLCTANAQMAESVDALVSNTSGAIHPGSIPGLGTDNGC